MGRARRLGDPIEAQALLATYGQGRGGAAVVAWVGEVEYWSYAGGGGCGGGDQDGAWRCVMGCCRGRCMLMSRLRQVDWSAGAVSLLT